MTPQRALELADDKANAIAELRYKSENHQLFHDEKVYLTQLREEEKILRHYAEIMQAEPVADVIRDSVRMDADDEYLHDLDWYPSDIDSLPLGTRLIIKPEPLK